MPEKRFPLRAYRVGRAGRLIRGPQYISFNPARKQFEILSNGTVGQEGTASDVLHSFHLKDVISAQVSFEPSREIILIFNAAADDITLKVLDVGRTVELKNFLKAGKPGIFADQ